MLRIHGCGFLGLVEKVDSPIGDENQFIVKPVPKFPLVEKVDSPIGDENTDEDDLYVKAQT